MNYQMPGRVKLIMEKQTFSSGFTKREFVITTQDDYPQDIKFECVKERCALLDALQPDDRVTVSFSIRGNEYKDRYFVNLQAGQVDKQNEDGSSITLDPQQGEYEEPVHDPDEHLPF